MKDNLIDIWQFVFVIRPSGGGPSGGKANDCSGAGRKRKSDFKKIEQSIKIAGQADADRKKGQKAND